MASGEIPPRKGSQTVGRGLDALGSIDLSARSSEAPVEQASARTRADEIRDELRTLDAKASRSSQASNNAKDEAKYAALEQELHALEGSGSAAPAQAKEAPPEARRISSRQIGRVIEGYVNSEQEPHRLASEAEAREKARQEEFQAGVARLKDSAAKRRQIATLAKKAALSLDRNERREIEGQIAALEEEIKGNRKTRPEAAASPEPAEETVPEKEAEETEPAGPQSLEGIQAVAHVPPSHEARKGKSRAELLKEAEQYIAELEKLGGKRTIPAAGSSTPTPEAGMAAGASYEGKPNFPVPAVIPEAPLAVPVPEKASASAAAQAAPESQKEAIEAQRARIRALMLATRGPEAVAQFDKEFEALGLRTSPQFYLDSARHAEQMLNSEKTYFDALRAHQKSRGDLGVVGEQMFGQKNLPPELQVLHDAWVKERAGYGEYLRSSAVVRHEDRLLRGPSKGGEIEGLKRYKGKKSLDRDAVLERHQRRFTVREIVLGAEEAENKTRIEGLDSREKGWVGKLLDGYKKKAKWIRVIASSALFAGAAIAGGAALAGGAVGWPILLAGASAVTALGALGAKRGSTSEKVLGAASIAGIFGFLGDSAVRGAHSIFGTKRKAKEQLEKREGLGNLGDASTLGALSGKRKHAVNAQSRIDLQARYARLGVAIASGAAAGAYLAEHPMSFGGHGEAAVGGTPEAAPAVELSVGDNINNADQLVGHFGQDLLEKYPDADTAPPAVQTLYRLLGEQDGKINLMTGEDPATLALGFQEGGQFSTIMHDGDTMRFHDGEIQFQKVGEDGWRTVIDENGNYGRVVDDLDKMNLQGEIRPGYGDASVDTAPVQPGAEIAASVGAAPAETAATAAASVGSAAPVEAAAGATSGVSGASETDVTRALNEESFRSAPDAAPAPQPQPPEVQPQPQPEAATPPEETPAAAEVAPTGAWTNANNVPINPNVTGVYGGEGGRELFTFGDTFERQWEAAREYVGANEDATIYVPREVNGERWLAEFSSNAEGQVGPVIWHRGDDLPVPYPDDPNTDFFTKVQFTPNRP